MLLGPNIYRCRWTLPLLRKAKIEGEIWVCGSRAYKATKIDALFVDDKGTSIALSCHYGNIHDIFDCGVDDSM